MGQTIAVVGLLYSGPVNYMTDFHSCTPILTGGRKELVSALLQICLASVSLTVYTSSDLMPVATCSPLPAGIEPKPGSGTYALS